MGNANGNDDALTERPLELTAEAKEAIKGSVREIATPARSSWDAIGALLCSMGVISTLPPVVSGRTSILLQQSLFQLFLHFSLLAFAAGFGWSAARNRHGEGRIVCRVIFVVATYLLFHRSMQLLG